MYIWFGNSQNFLHSFWCVVYYKWTDIFIPKKYLKKYRECTSGFDIIKTSYNHFYPFHIIIWVIFSSLRVIVRIFLKILLALTFPKDLRMIFVRKGCIIIWGILAFFVTCEYLRHFHLKDVRKTFCEYLLGGIFSKLLAVILGCGILQFEWYFCSPLNYKTFCVNPSGLDILKTSYDHFVQGSFIIWGILAFHVSCEYWRHFQSKNEHKKFCEYPSRWDILKTSHNHFRIGHI
jgi:hypothetical protein